MWLLLLVTSLIPSVNCDQTFNFTSPAEIGRSYFFHGGTTELGGDVAEANTLRISFLTASGECPLHLKYFLDNNTKPAYVRCYTKKNDKWSIDGLTSYREAILPATPFEIVVRISSKNSIEIFNNGRYQPSISSCVDSEEGVKWLLESVNTAKDGRYRDHEGEMIGQYGQLYPIPHTETFNPNKTGHIIGYLRHNHPTDFWMSLTFIDKNDNGAFKMRFTLGENGTTEITSSSHYTNNFESNQAPIFKKGFLFKIPIEYTKREKHHVFTVFPPEKQDPGAIVVATVYTQKLPTFIKIAEYFNEIQAVKIISNGIDIHHVDM